MKASVVKGADQLFYSRPRGAPVLNMGGPGNGDADGFFAFARTLAVTPPIGLAAGLMARGLPPGPARLPLPKTPGTEDNVFINPPPDAKDAVHVSSMLALGAA